MTYTAQPLLNDRDKVRFLAGDTDPQNRFVQDEEIAYALDVQPSVNLAAAVIAEAIGSQFLCQCDETVGALSRKCGQLAENYFKRAKDLRALESHLALPFFGGLTLSGKESLAEDTDAVQPGFRRGQDDFPGTNPSITDLFQVLT